MQQYINRLINIGLEKSRFVSEKINPWGEILSKIATISFAGIGKDNPICLVELK